MINLMPSCRNKATTGFMVSVNTREAMDKGEAGKLVERALQVKSQTFDAPGKWGLWNMRL